MMFGGADRRADLAPHHRAGPRGRRQLHRHGRRLQRGAGRRRSTGRAIAGDSATNGSSRPRSRTRWTRARTSGGLSRKWVMQAADDSLRRLGTDYIDIYYLHKEDHATPLAETVRAIGDLVRRARSAISASPTTAPGASPRSAASCDELGIDRPVVSQPYYNAMNRMPEVEHLPACAHLRPRRRALQPARARRAHRQVRPERAAARRHARRPPGRAHAADRVAAGVARDRAEDEEPRRGSAASRAGALRGGLGAEQQLVTARHRRAAHRGAVGRLRPALAYRFTAEDEALVDSLVTPGHPSTPGYNDPAYPLEGRVTWTGA